MLPAMLGADDDASDFVPRDPTVAAAHRRVPHLRLGRTGRVLEALIPAVIEQRVPGADCISILARPGVQAWAHSASGPAPAGMRVAPSAEVCAKRSVPGSSIAPMWIRGGRRTAVGCASRATSLERLVTQQLSAQARDALQSLPGIGVDRRRDRAAVSFGDAGRGVGRRLPHSEDDRLDTARSSG